MKELFDDIEFETASGKDLLSLECYFCKNEFKRNKNRINLVRKGKSKDSFKFCSLACSSKSRVKKIEMTCTKCNSVFLRRPVEASRVNNVFCSRSCSASFNNLGKTRNKVIHTNICLGCGELIDNKRKYCSKKCFYGSKWTLKIKEIESGNKFANSESMARVYAKRYLLQINGHQCEVCKNKKWMKKPIPLTCDHIDGNSQNNSINNFRLICANCDRQQPTFGSRNKGMGRKSRRKKS